MPKRPELPDEGKATRKAKCFPIIFSECGVQGGSPTLLSVFSSSLEFRSLLSACSYVSSNERHVYKLIFLLLKIKKSLKSTCFPPDPQNTLKATMRLMSIATWHLTAAPKPPTPQSLFTNVTASSYQTNFRPDFVFFLIFFFLFGLCFRKCLRLIPKRAISCFGGCEIILRCYRLVLAVAPLEGKKAPSF